MPGKWLKEEPGLLLPALTIKNNPNIATSTHIALAGVIFSFKTGGAKMTMKMGAK